jgi:hypothetical protein
MKERDLRIGNEIMVAGSHYKIVAIDAYKGEVQLQEIGVIELSKCKPIPLTEEWLIKFGFVFDGFRYQQEINNNLWVLVKNNVYGWYSPHIEISNGIQNVHQLQNLYFALTGEELKPTL